MHANSRRTIDRQRSTYNLRLASWNACGTTSDPLEFVDEVPFKDVLLNGIVRDEKGKKMSKSLGNGIDPLEMIDKFSADAVFKLG